MSLKLPGIGKPLKQCTWTLQDNGNHVVVKISHTNGFCTMNLRTDDVWKSTQGIVSAVNRYLQDGLARHAFKISPFAERHYVELDQLGRFSGEIT